MSGREVVREKRCKMKSKERRGEDMLSQDVKLMINELANDVIKMFQIKIPIMNIDHVVEILGGRVEENRDDFCQYGDSISKHGDSFVIRISPFCTQERRNLIIAYELGHLFLHMGYKTNLNIWESQKEGKFMESMEAEQFRRANFFSYAFLMPEKEYREILEKNTDGEKIDTESIAEYFCVPRAAAAQRGRQLHLIK